MIDAEDLPDGWAVAKVGEIAASIQSGFACGAHNRDGRGTIHLRPMNITAEGLLSLEDVRHIEGECPHKVGVGDVLFNNTNSAELVGKTALILESSGHAFSNHMTRIRCKSVIEPAFLAIQLNTLFRSGYFQTRCNNHVSQASISASYLRDEVEVVIPPLAEQRRIVAKVEELTARSRAARAALAEVPTLLEQFRQSVLASAFRGDLTADWRAKNPTAEPASVLLDRIRAERRKQWETKYPKKKYVEPEPVDDSDLPELPEGWEYARADEIVATGTVITYGIVLPGDPVDGGVPYVRGQDIEDGRILVEQLARTTPEIAARHDRSSLQQGDVLLCIIRHLKVAIVPAGIDGANLTQGTVRLRPSQVILGPYLAGYLAGPTAQAWMKERYFGMAMPRINVEDARAIPIPIAPIEEQREIIRQIDASERRRATALAEVTQALDESGGLDQSILAKAFRGELVPQDPADEPASDLLERIRQQQDSGTNGTASAPKRRRTTSK
jgi:type I restriction enzyme, S subunit